MPELTTNPSISILRPMNALKPIGITRARWYIVVAAIMWSTSGMLGKLIALPGPTMACLRALFAATALVPALRWRAISFRPAMVGMVACFATMNLCYVTSITLTTAANAIFLQYTAPAWMFVASVFWLREPMDRRSLTSLLVGMIGIAVIILGNWRDSSLGVALGLFSGAAYAGVAVFLRLLRDENPFWLTIINHLMGGLLLLPFVLRNPQWSLVGISSMQYFGLFLFGVAQMAIPYVLFSRGLSAVTPQEAGIITLLEPVLNPVLTYVTVGEVPGMSTIVGGAVILSGVALRYWRAG